MAAETRSMKTPALFVGQSPIDEGAALLRFFTPDEGALLLRAKGLSKPQSHLAPRLLPADELELHFLAGRGSPILTGVNALREHGHWRGELSLLALYWFFVECAWLGSAESAGNEQVYRLIVNLLRSEPAAPAWHSALSVFCLKLLALHGLLPQLTVCAVSGEALAPGEVAHLLPGGHELVGLREYNRVYAPSNSRLLRLDAARRARWKFLLRAPLLDYARAEADSTDSALLLHMTQQALADIAAREIKAARFLAEQWKLPALEEL